MCPNIKIKHMVGLAVFPSSGSIINVINCNYLLLITTVIPVPVQLNTMLMYPQEYRRTQRTSLTAETLHIILTPIYCHLVEGYLILLFLSEKHFFPIYQMTSNGTIMCSGTVLGNQIWFSLCYFVLVLLLLYRLLTILSRLMPPFPKPVGS